jgi:hypothetical protein
MKPWKNIILCVLFIGALFLFEGSVVMTSALTTNKAKNLANNFAVIYVDLENQELEKWTLASHGIFISPRLVISTRHFLNFKMKFWINGFRAKLISLSDAYDLAIFETDHVFVPGQSGDYQPFDLCLNPIIGEKIYTSEAIGRFFFWKEAGTIKEVLFDKIVLEGYAPKPGESGKPIFNSNGELVGLVQICLTEDKEAILIPALFIAPLLN